MTWTYANAPDSSTAAGKRDAVRLLVGDTDTTDQQISDEEIAFALSENSNVYRSASAVASMIAGKYARLVSTSIDGNSIDFGARVSHYNELATRLQAQAKKQGNALGGMSAGGISVAGIEAANSEPDRPAPSFQRGQFTNPPGVSSDDPRIDDD